MHKHGACSSFAWAWIRAWARVYYIGQQAGIRRGVRLDVTYCGFLNGHI